ncbi:VENN motif pre-toxin domain-containing protein, partial [Avibacterium avium]|uniref:VENN motif pre-toxin domain-containing protein n=4 Tax=Avibacterium avium TaxID=751 RepID=UPI003BF91E32
VQEQQEMAKVLGNIADNSIAIATYNQREEIARLKREKAKVENQQGKESPQVQALNQQILQREQHLDNEFGLGSTKGMAIRAVTAALQSAVQNDPAGALTALASPYLNQTIHQATEGNREANLMAHALLSAVEFAATGKDPITGAIAGVTGEATAQYLTKALYNKTPNELTASEKENISTLSQLAGGLAGAFTAKATGNTPQQGGSFLSAVAGAETAKRAVENNYLSNWQKAKLKEELEKCQDDLCRLKTKLSWAITDMNQDASLAGGIIASVPESLYETVDGIISIASNPSETLEALKMIVMQDNAFSAITESVKQNYIARIEYLQREYERAGVSGAFNAGREVGKLATEVVSIVAGGAGIAKSGIKVAEVATAGISKGKTILLGKSKLPIVGKTVGYENQTTRISTGAENVALYPKLKLDLKTEEYANNVILSLKSTGNLPSEYITKEIAISKYNWKPGKPLKEGKIGGDIFLNKNKILPTSEGRIWREADLGVDSKIGRNKQPGIRLLYSNDGLLFITNDHYESFKDIGRWK